ncbi:hypothetical protein D9758_014421 [Tetrapyrgos nigripes]|uniref:Methyltransferase domain-containing protein n=1 Tax=Tetrapyrgos nigripes TaxID=182062 RepID=A0A8H5CN43_9AGAR|nr:hypothetical protein D9758_014421 [Tetrapyrgos nigripes]
MSTENQAVYEAIGKNQQEGQRLEEQYPLFKKYIRRDRVIFDEAVTLGDNAVVLDVGTGAGSWVLDFAQTVPPSVSIHAVDISTTFFPTIHPQNIVFAKHSGTALPQTWTDKFDFINQNLLAGCLTGDDWIQNLQELFRVTKPGGHIQLFEPSFASWDCPPNSANGKMKSMYKVLFDNTSLIYDLGVKLPQMLLDTGFVDVGQHKSTFPVNMNDGVPVQQCVGMMIRWLRNLQPPILRLGLLGSAEEYESLLKEIQEEWNHGVPTENFFVIHARKPVA